MRVVTAMHRDRSNAAVTRCREKGGGGREIAEEGEKEGEQKMGGDGHG